MQDACKQCSDHIDELSRMESLYKETKEYALELEEDKICNEKQIQRLLAAIIVLESQRDDEMRMRFELEGMAHRDRIRETLK